jgi:hypothetical protein
METNWTYIKATSGSGDKNDMSLSAALERRLIGVLGEFHLAYRAYWSWATL